jgi:glyoxylase-like metal-dependent hydrolase (beta-lactamase superfamily II)
MYMALKVEVIPNGPIMGNALVLWDDATKKAVIVDPGDEPDRIAGCPRVLGLTVTEIVATHAHIDHAGAAAALKKSLEVPFALHSAERPVLEALSSQSAMFGLGRVEVPEVDRWLEEGDVLEIGEIKGRVIHTPGHTPGGCCFFFEEEKILVAGDTLFQGSIGRTDLPGGSFEQIISSIKDKLLPLGEEVVVYCGHGPKTTLGMEARHNPFVR